MANSMDFSISADNSGAVAEALTDACARAMEICGGKAETYAKKYCPVDTGRLRNSITHQVESNGKAVIIGTNVEYAPFVELGTRYMGEEPYLRPALENHMNEYKQIIKSEFG